MHRQPSATWSLAALLGALAFASCADEANPMLPSSEPPNPLSTQAGSMGGTGVVSTGQPNVATGVTGTDALPTLGAECDLLAQNCHDSSLACYPVSGAGRCDTAGSNLAQGSCTASKDCIGGLACIDTPTIGPVCLPLCGVDSQTRPCAATYTCERLSGSDSVGTCQ
jgi:hypothetical protein